MATVTSGPSCHSNHLVQRSAKDFHQAYKHVFTGYPRILVLYLGLILFPQMICSLTDARIDSCIVDVDPIKFSEDLCLLFRFNRDAADPDPFLPNIR